MEASNRIARSATTMAIAVRAVPHQKRCMPAQVLVAALSTLWTTAHGDALPPVSYPSLAPFAPSAQGFTPPGWGLEARQSGDLNGDGLLDLALVFHQQDPRNVVSAGVICGETVNTNPRILAVAFAQRGGGYRLMVQNHTLVPRYDNACAEDWFSGEGVAGGGLEIARGAVRVRLGHFMSAGGWGMGSTTYTFRWQGDALRLIGFDHTNTERNTGEIDTLSINYLTRRVKITRGSISDDKETSRWSSVPSKSLLTIEQIGDGLEFDPDGLVGDL